MPGPDFPSGDDCTSPGDPADSRPTYPEEDAPMGDQDGDGIPESMDCDDDDSSTVDPDTCDATAADQMQAELAGLTFPASQALVQMAGYLDLTQDEIATQMGIPLEMRTLESPCEVSFVADNTDEPTILHVFIRFEGGVAESPLSYDSYRHISVVRKADGSGDVELSVWTLPAGLRFDEDSDPGVITWLGDDTLIHDAPGAWFADIDVDGHGDDEPNDEPFHGPCEDDDGDGYTGPDPDCDDDNSSPS